jgi:hypothetical protein
MDAREANNWVRPAASAGGSGEEREQRRKLRREQTGDECNDCRSSTQVMMGPKKNQQDMSNDKWGNEGEDKGAASRRQGSTAVHGGPRLEKQAKRA